MEVGETLSILDEDVERADAARAKLFNCIAKQVIELADVVVSVGTVVVWAELVLKVTSLP